MPELWRTRIVNVYYGKHGERQIPDLKFEYFGKNGLSVLANGGGKTTLLQLALQTQLPNAHLQKRKFKDYVKPSNGAGHVISEIKLDGPGNHFVLLGICYDYDSDADDHLKYFTYTIEYSAPNSYDILSLPFVKNCKVIKYTELKNFLKDAKSNNANIRIRIFDRDERASYLRELANFNIFSSEFESIRTVNDAEGGMGIYFANLTTNHSLLRRLIEIIDKVAIDDEGQLTKLFQTYTETILRIPSLRKDIEDFKALKRGGIEVLDSVRKCSESKEAFLNQKGYISKVLKSIIIELNEISTSLQEIESQIEKLNTQDRELCYQRDSLPIVKEQIELEAISAELVVIKEELGQLETENQNLNATINKNKATNKVIEIREIEATIAGLKKKIDLAGKDQEEKLEELDRNRTAFRFLLKELIEAEKVSLASGESNLAALTLKIKETEQAIKNKTDEVNTISNRIAALENSRESYDEKYQALYREYRSFEWMEDPAQAIRKLELDKGQKQTQKEELVKEKEEATALSELSQTKVGELKGELGSLKKHKENLEEKIQGFKDRLAEVQDELFKHSIDSDNVFTDQSKIEATLNLKKINLEKAIGGCKRQIDELTTEIKNLSENYVPHDEITKVRDKIKDEFGIDALLGSEWLAHQNLSNEGKEQFLRHNPLLLYAVVLTEGELNLIRKAKNWHDFRLDFPVPLVVSGPNLTPKNELLTESLVSISDGSFLIWHKGYDYAIYKEEREKRRQELMNKRITFEEKMKFAEDELNHRVTPSINTMRIFYNQFSLDGVRTNELSLETTAKAILAKESELKVLDQQIIDLSKCINESEESIQTLNSEIGELKASIQKFVQWQKDYEKNAKETHEKTEKTKLLDKANKEKIGLETVLNEYTDKAGALKLSNQKTRMFKEIHLKELGEVKHPVNKETFPVIEGKTFEQVKEEWKAAEASYGMFAQQIDNIQATVDAEERRKKELLKALQVLGFTTDDFELDIHTISEFDIGQLELKLKNKERHLEERGAIAHIKELSEASKQSSVNILINQFNLKYCNRDVYQPLRSLEIETENISNQLKKIQAEKQEWFKYKEEIEGIQTKLQETKIALEPTAITHAIGPAELGVSEEEWNALKSRIQAKDIATKLNGLKNAFDEAMHNVDQAFKSYKETLSRRENQKVNRFVTNVLSNETIRYEYAELEKGFKAAFTAMDELERIAAYELDKAESNKKVVVERCIGRAKLVYDNLKSIPDYVRVDYKGRSERGMKIKQRDWPSTQEQVDSDMVRHIDNLIIELAKMVAECKTKEEQEKYIHMNMSSGVLLDKICPLDKAHIVVLKPQEIELNGDDFDNWENVPLWSKGEQYAAYLAVFMAIVNYSHCKNKEDKDSRKVLFADNPFGQASSKHLLDFIFSMADRNNFQMICYTALTESTVYQYIPTVYTLKNIPLADHIVLSSQQTKGQHSNLESGFYHLDAELERKVKDLQEEFNWFDDKLED